eukprot:9490058-Heterocapsa_arctica.AAC.1
MGCSDIASGPPVSILHEDAYISDVGSLSHANGVFGVPLCGHHCHRYRASFLRRKCAYVDCQRAGLPNLDGMYLCAAHCRKWVVDRNEEPDATCPLEVPRPSPTT